MTIEVFFYGLLGAFIGIYLKENFRIAKKLKSILLRYKVVLQHEIDTFPNVEGYKEILSVWEEHKTVPKKKAYKQSDIAELISEISHFFQEKKVSSSNDKLLFEMYASYKNNPIGEYEILDFQKLEDEILQKNLYLSNEEIGLLKSELAYSAYNLKVHLINFSRALISFHRGVSDMKTYDKVKFKKYFIPFIEQFIILLELLNITFEMVKKEAGKSSLRLFLRNIFQ